MTDPQRRPVTRRDPHESSVQFLAPEIHGWHRTQKIANWDWWDDPAMLQHWMAANTFRYLAETAAPVLEGTAFCDLYCDADTLGDLIREWDGTAPLDFLYSFDAHGTELAEPNEQLEQPRQFTYKVIVDKGGPGLADNEVGIRIQAYIPDT